MEVRSAGKPDLQRVWKMKRLIHIIPILFLLIISGCIPFTSYVSPEVLPLKEKSTAVYLSRYIPQNDENGIDILDIKERIGLGRNFDIGAGITINDVFTGSVNTDLKYQFKKAPLPMAFSLGLSYTGAIAGFNIYGIYGIHPSLAIGYKKTDLNLTGNIIRPFGEIDIKPVSYTIINASYEIRSFFPEITLVIPPTKNDDLMLLVGFGIKLGKTDKQWSPTGRAR